MAGERLGRARHLVHEDARPLAGEQGHGALLRAEASALRQRGPRRAFLVLGEAHAVLVRAAVGGPVHAARPAAAHVADHELQRPPDGRVGPVALAQHIQPAVHADPAADRAVDDQHRRHRHGRGQQAVHVELVGAGRLQGRDHHRQVLGTTARQHGVDGHLLHGALGHVRRHHGHDVGGGAVGALQHRQHPRLGGRHYRHAVGPAPVVHRLPGVLQGGDLDAPALEPRPREAHRQLVGQRRVDAERAAAGPELRQALAETRSAGEGLPLLTRPALDALDGPAGFDLEQRGDGVDVVVPRQGEVGVVQHPVGIGGEPWVVLGDDAEPGGVREFGEHGRHQHAGGAVVLDHGDEAIGQRRHCRCCRRFRRGWLGRRRGCRLGGHGRSLPQAPRPVSIQAIGRRASRRCRPWRNCRGRSRRAVMIAGARPAALRPEAKRHQPSNAHRSRAH